MPVVSPSMPPAPPPQVRAARSSTGTGNSSLSRKCFAECAPVAALSLCVLLRWNLNLDCARLHKSAVSFFSFFLNHACVSLIVLTSLHHGDCCTEPDDIFIKPIVLRSCSSHGYRLCYNFVRCHGFWASVFKNRCFIRTIIWYMGAYSYYGIAILAHSNIWRIFPCRSFLHVAEFTWIVLRWSQHGCGVYDKCFCRRQ